jgi:Holliday junction resolvase RusA-like endonuclease
MISLVIPGEVIPQLRPRFSTREDFPRDYDQEKCKNYKAYVRILAANAYEGPVLDEPMSLRLTVFRLPPMNWGKAKTADALRGKLRPTSKPDLSNLLKGIEDALTGIVWRDDSRVVEISLSKWYSPHPRAEVNIDRVWFYSGNL